MPRNGLTRQRVVEAAAGLIEQSGPAAFSMRALADALQVKTASLYNHIESMDTLLTEVCIYALQMQRDALLHAIDGQSGPAAITALANACRRFARDHRELYRLITRTAPTCGGRLEEISSCTVTPFLAVLEGTALTEPQKLHWQRVLRCIIHGFVVQEDAGFFTHLLIDAEESFQTVLQCCMDGLTQAEKRNAP